MSWDKDATESKRRCYCDYCGARGYEWIDTSVDTYDWKFYPISSIWDTDEELMRCRRHMCGACQEMLPKIMTDLETGRVPK
jgi:hypothetical protein